MLNDGPAEGFLDYLIAVENPNDVGFSEQDGRFYPHESPEGGMPTVGYGHKLREGEEHLARGITRAEALALLRDDVVQSVLTAQAVVDKKFGGGTFSELSAEQQEMLAEFAFNIGPLFARKFPKFTKAVIEGDMATAQQQAARSYTDAEGQRHELKQRNAVFAERYFPETMVAGDE